MRPKVTVYVTCHNYGRYLRQAVDSVLAQILTDWEMILIDDGSADDSRTIIDDYVNSHQNRIRSIINEKPRGLPYCANRAMEMARGEYLMRLDADDYLDESALLTMAAYLDARPEAALVYPNYVYVDEDGTYLGIEQRKKIGDEAKLLDLPAHGACTMVRKRILKAVGGYDERYNAQDGHDLWLKVLNRYQVGNVATSLFYYRQHPASLSRDENRILSARQRIKRGIAARLEGGIKPRIVGLVPAKNTYKSLPGIVLRPFAGKPLIDYTLEAARNSGILDGILVTSDDPEVLAHCGEAPDVMTLHRDISLSQNQVKLTEVLANAVEHMERDFGLFADVLVVLNVHSPLRTADDIREAIDTLLLYDVDSVTSVYEDYELHFTHGAHGLKPLNPGMLNKLRLEREALYVDNGALKVIWRDMVGGSDLYGRTFGHVVMPMERSHRVTGAFETWLVEQILNRQNSSAPGAVRKPVSRRR